MGLNHKSTGSFPKWHEIWCVFVQLTRGTEGKQTDCHLYGHKLPLCVKIIFAKLSPAFATTKLALFPEWGDWGTVKEEIQVLNSQKITKKCRKAEYVQRRVCFVNVQVRCALVVCTWKCRFFCLCAHRQCRVYYIYHVEFHFRFELRITFPI